MKSVYVLVVVLMCLVMMISAAPRCPVACSREASPTCGFNGSCFKVFGSSCFMENYNCGARSKFQQVAEEKCANRQLRCTE